MAIFSDFINQAAYWHWPKWIYIFRKKKISARTLRAMMETLDIQMSAGVEHGQVLTGFLNRAKHRNLYKRDQPFIQRIISKMKAGNSLSESLKPHLSNTEYVLISSGEQSGNVITSMRLIMDLSDQRKRIVSTLRSSLTAPIIYMVTLIITLLIISYQVLPAMESILPASKWTGLAAIIYDSTLLLQPSGMLIIFFAITALVVFIKLALPNWTGTGRLLAEKYIPGFGLYRDYQGALWIGTFGAMLQAGMSDTYILQIQIGQASPWMAERLRRIWLSMKEGFSFGEAVVYAGPKRIDRSRPNSGIKYDFPSPRINDDIENFAGYAGFETKLLTMRNVWLNQQEKDIKTKLGFIGVLVQGLVFGYFILLTMGINELSAQISSAVGN